MINSGIMSSNSIEYATPQWLFDVLDKQFHFVLDPCATDKNAKCKQYYTVEDNGLVQDWVGPVFMNPPYGREIIHWVRKAYESNQLVVALLPARTDTIWFHDWVYYKAELEFIKGRLHFNDSYESAPFPSMLAVYKPRESNNEKS
jgi:site-specific DNA-methyltransferase (adenine-specific)